MKLITVYEARKEFTEDAFLRQVLIELGTRKNTPIDVVDCAFGKVRERVKEVLSCTAFVQGECTASVGYDRKEQYVDYRTKVENVGGSHKTVKEPVIKEKTVTDWHPFSKRYSGEAACAVYNTDKDNADDGRIMTAIISTKRECYCAAGEAAVNQSALKTAIRTCERQIEKKENQFPGNHVKDERYRSTSTVKDLLCFRLPYYEVTYTYKGKEYTAGGFACGKIKTASEYPPNDVDVTAIVKEKTRDLENREKLIWRIFAGSVILGLVLPFVVQFGWMWILSAVCLLLAMKSSKEYRNAYTECSNRFSNDVMKSKVAALKEALKKHGFEPLKEEQTESLESYSIEGAAKLKDLTYRIIGSWFLVFLVLVAGLAA